VIPGILQRTIFGELAKVFSLSLVGITGIILMAAIVVQASQQGLGPAQILAAIPLLIPSMLPFIIPPTTLFATCVVYGRLSHDNEITAVKSAGVNLMHVAWPSIFLGAAMSAITMGLYYYLIPYSQHVLRSVIIKDVEEFLYAMLKRDHELRGRPELKLAYEISVKQVQGRDLRSAVFKRRDPTKGGYDVVATAEHAELWVDNGKQPPEIHVHMRNAQVMDGKDRVYSQDQDYYVPMPDINRVDRFSPRDMTWKELLANRRKVIARMQELDTFRALRAAQKSPPSPPGELNQVLRDVDNIKHVEQLKLNALNCELQMRPALSCGCLFFVLVGCPVGVWFSRSDYLSAFITCFLPIVVLYYPIQLCTTGLAKDGKLHPALALWAADTAMAVIAVVLFRRLLKN
jgi:lipopolysaccharide export system permease protein